MNFSSTKWCNSPIQKKMWGKLQTTYEGYRKFKESKLQAYIGQFEQLRMNENEDMTAYIIWVDQLVNTIIGLGEDVEVGIIVW